ncbi:hypothetical protein [Microbacterium flavum]|uniref:DUF4190 domain-containing protein n=1 Tax=Microbacterium flavum TaxID=415216 RepID=A0ABS5XPV3_9MICO|nr:hypothetical protein [Microbacterium flavum]MBT8796558.1 hypothetical protein [Microbacterium flavum]
MSAAGYGHLNQRDPSVPDATAPFDPLRLCVFTTIALLACLLGPVAVLVFAAVAIGGYSRARRAGLLRSRCKLGATRTVLIYLWTVAVASAVAIPFWIMMWVRVWS